jgi:hypothetical protein
MGSPSECDAAPAAAAAVCSFLNTPLPLALSSRPPFIAGEVVFVALSDLSYEQCYMA